MCKSQIKGILRSGLFYTEGKFLGIGPSNTCIDSPTALLSFASFGRRKKEQQFHGSHLQAKEDEQQRNWMSHEHCSLSWFSPLGKGRGAAAELDAV
jgi:hypothetical protein